MRAFFKNNHKYIFGEINDFYLTENFNNDVIIKVNYAGICKTDIDIYRGIVNIDSYENSNTNFNYKILGHEFCGTVIKVNGDFTYTNINTKICVGDIVTANPMNTCSYEKNNQNYMLGRNRDGCFAEYIQLPSHCLYKLPNELNDCIGAMIEPIAAAYAIYDKIFKIWDYGINSKAREDLKIGVFVNNIDEEDRFVRLIRMIVEDHNFKITTIPYTQRNQYNNFDVMIETKSEYLKDYANLIRFGGNIILKSRAYSLSTICINDIVTKEITIHGARYSSFENAINYAFINHDRLKTFVEYCYNFDNNGITEALYRAEFDALDYSKGKYFIKI